MKKNVMYFLTFLFLILINTGMVFAKTESVDEIVEKPINMVNPPNYLEEGKNNFSILPRNMENTENPSGGVTVDKDYCADPNFIKPFVFIGRIFSVIKILVPIIIIAFGVWDFFRAVVAAKDDEIKKSMKSLIMRVIAGLVIFFIPAIIHFVFKLVDDWNQYDSDYSKCSLCITDPGAC